VPFALTVTFAGSGDAFGSGGRYQACIHLRPGSGSPVLLDCGATSLGALKRLELEPARSADVLGNEHTTPYEQARDGLTFAF
jgi:hypothetical protein